jgi:hypothetical protein
VRTRARSDDQREPGRQRQHRDLWTRFADYDTQGGKPGHDYSYERVGLDDLDPLDPRTLDPNMPLPGEGWISHASIPTEGHGAVSQEITILQTGLGNAAREVRVVGFPVPVLRCQTGCLPWFVRHFDRPPGRPLDS